MVRKPKPVPTGRVAAEADMAHRALEVLQHLDVDARLEPAKKRAHGRQPDFIAHIGHGRNRKTYLVEVKRGLRPATLGPLIMRFLETNAPALLVTEYVTPAMAELLRKADIAFVDLAGNAYFEQPGLKLYVTGRKPERILQEARTTRAFLPAGLRVLFVLLCAPEHATVPTRELAAKTGVANGTVGRVLQDLRKEGFLHVLDRHKRKLTRLRELLDRWTEAYPGQLRPQFIKGRYRTQNQDWWKKVKYRQDTVMLGGEPAADRLTRYLKPATVTLYVRGEPRIANEVIARHGLRRDPDGNIEILNAFWPVDLPTDIEEVVPTPLVYADLLATGDTRCIETARLIYDQYLTGRFGEN